MNEIRFLAIKLLGALIVAPILGKMVLLLIDKGSYWLSKDQKRRWIILSITSFMLAGISGWLR